MSAAVKHAPTCPVCGAPADVEPINDTARALIGVGDVISGMVAAEAEVLGHEPSVSGWERKVMDAARVYREAQTARMEAHMENFRASGGDPKKLVFTPPISRGSSLTSAEAWILNKAVETLPSLTERDWPHLQAGDDPTQKQIDWLMQPGVWGASATCWAERDLSKAEGRSDA